MLLGVLESPAVALEGFHAVKHALRFAPALVRSVTVASRPAVARLCSELAPDIAEQLLARAVEGVAGHPTGVVGSALRPRPDRSALAARTAPLVVLDDPRHPGNVGAVVRVAAAVGASAVAVSGPLDPWGAAAVRGSAGLHYALPVLRCELSDVAGTVVVLSDDGGRFTRLPSDAALVVGSERAGVSAAWRARADAVVALPMRPGVSSLNLATAVSAALYAWALDEP